MQSLTIRKDERALVIGAGPIGLLHLLLLKERKALVTMSDKHDSKLKAAKKLGADFVRKPPRPPIRKDGIGFDYVFECTGIPEVWEASVGYLRRGGTAVLFGGCKSGTRVTYDAGRIHYDEITIKGVFHYTPSDVRKAYELLRKKDIDVSPLISGSYALKHTQKAFEKLSKGIGIKYAIMP